MYTLKSIAQRGSLLGATAALVIAAVVPSAAVFADALNPLTERSLLLSSSAPGYMDTDGSGNSNAAPNSIGENYAPAGSGPNGKKSGETFTFTVSSSATIKAFSLQYCTTAAGLCQAPGDNTGDERTPDRQTNAVAHPLNKSDLDFVDGGTDFAQAAASTAPAAGQFQVYVNGTATAVTGWTLAKDNKEDNAHAGALTGKNNYVTLANTTGIALANGDDVKIVFEPSETTYITNPGSGAFFVKINTFDTDTALDIVEGGIHNIDGGVTVANVMTESIHITTKVLETMAFSVGIKNRDTVDIGTGQIHGKCDPIQQTDGTNTNNRLNLGNPSAEYSLEVGKAWDVNSYWRLSSNSSGGATVYYSGNTLANTVGDEIAEMPTETVSTPGTEQFGLGFVDAGTNTGQDLLDTGAATWAAGYTAPRSFPFKTLASQTAAPYDTLGAQPLSGDYDQATGTLDDGSAGPGTAKFKFLKSSLTVPEPIAQQNDQVISCSTAKMRYVANIGADTPAGVYTTKINYLAAPQY